MSTKKTEILIAGLIYTAFFGLIGLAIWWTHSAMALWALLLMPSIRYRDDTNGEE